MTLIAQYCRRATNPDGDGQPPEAAPDQFRGRFKTFGANCIQTTTGRWLPRRYGSFVVSSPALPRDERAATPVQQGKTLLQKPPGVGHKLPVWPVLNRKISEMQ